MIVFQSKYQFLNPSFPKASKTDLVSQGTWRQYMQRNTVCQGSSPVSTRELFPYLQHFIL